MKLKKIKNFASHFFEQHKHVKTQSGEQTGNETRQTFNLQNTPEAQQKPPKPPKTKKLTQKSVKEAFDQLPSGICFFDEDGVLVLCNMTMQKIAKAILGHSLKSIEEFETAINNASTQPENVCLYNGISWKFNKKQIFDQNKNSYTEITAVDVTELVLRKKELELNNKRLKEAQRQLQKLSANVVEATREEEILSMKMRIHDTMGRSLISARRILAENVPLEDSTPIINEWESAVKLLQGAARQIEYADALEELRSAANGLIEIELSGELPPQKDISYLIVSAVRECATNAVRYAAASKLYVSICSDCKTNHILVEITNNGTPPAQPVVEGGGLSSLRKSIEQAGGQMEIDTQQKFMLKINLMQEVNDDTSFNS